MPDEVVRLVRQAWSRAPLGPACALQADLRTANVRISGPRRLLRDWDEAHVNDPGLDWAAIPARARPAPSDATGYEAAELAWALAGGADRAPGDQRAPRTGGAGYLP